MKKRLPSLETIQQAMASQYKQAHPSTNIESELTHREKDVLLLLAEELTNQEIASKLHISPNTVKRHTAALYRKLDVKNRRQAVVEARRADLIPTDTMEIKTTI